MAKRLSSKEKGFVRDIVKGKTGTQAVLDNYDTTSEKTAGVMASENLAKPRIQNAIKSIADQIPDELLVEKHLELLNLKDKKGIDPQAVGKGLDMAYKIKGTYAPEKKDVHVEGKIDTQDAKFIELAKKYEEELKKNL